MNEVGKPIRKVIRRLRQSTARERRVLGGVVFVLVFILVYPFQTTVVPIWRLRVVDDLGATVSGINVTEHWRHNLLETNGHEELQKTNVQGEVGFSRRTIRASLLSRALALIMRLLKEGNQARVAPYAAVVVWGGKDNETSVAVYEGSDTPPPQIVAARVR